MYVYLSHKSSLEYWRSADPILPSMSVMNSIAVYPTTILEDERTTRLNLVLPGKPETDALGKLPLNISMPLHVLVDHDFLRRDSRIMHSHVCSAELPEKQFIAVEHELAVSSPELTFFQLAQQLSLERLVLLGMEFCGYYSLDQAVPDGFRQHQPYTTVEKLREMADGLKIAGVKNARRALKYIVNGAASPMEAKIIAYLCLPYFYGGCAIPLPEANPRIVFNDETYRTYGWRYCACDLYWPEAHFAVEYQGFQHGGVSAIRRDVEKSVILRAEGIDCQPLDFAQFADGDKRAAVAGMIAKKLGKRLQPRLDDYEARRAKLGAMLFERNHSVRLGAA